MTPRTLRFIIPLVVLVGILSLGRVIFDYFNDTTHESQAQPLLTVGVSGGLCGNGYVCSSATKLYDDGHWRGDREYENMSDEKISKLKTLIEAFSNEAPPTAVDDCGNSLLDGADRFLSSPSWPPVNYERCALTSSSTTKIFNEIVETLDLD